MRREELYEESTTDLLNKFKDLTTTDDFEEFLDNYGNTPEVDNVLAEGLKQNNLKAADLVRNCAGYLSKSYIYAILSGDRKNPSRDNAILLCIGAHFNKKMTRRFLESCGLRSLYIKDPRDLAIIHCIEKNIFDIEDINEFLLGHNLTPFKIS